MRIRVIHGIDDLASDMAAIPVRFSSQAPRAVRRNVEQGNRLAKTLARSRAGRHGEHYYKRLTAEMVTPWVGEYGPEGTPKTNFVGVGFRSGRNMDLPNSADVVGPRLAKDVGDIVDRLFW